MREFTFYICIYKMYTCIYVYIYITYKCKLYSIMCKLRSKMFLCSFGHVSIFFFPCLNKLISQSVSQDLRTKLSPHLFWAQLCPIIWGKSQKLLTAFLLLRFNSHSHIRHCAVERDGWSLMAVYTYTSNSIVTVPNWNLFQGFVHSYKAWALFAVS